ncbi:VOC family virulence protein, partial [Limosilactobacillus reuteri]|uniref:VOC family protein n=1 Tax=Limosilactobacillus reuteri TaxID=1598 RepID=UPI000B9828AE
MKMRRIDHVLLTVTDLEQSMRFYHEVFDMPVIKEQSNDDLITMRCGHQLIRLQKIDRPTTLKAANPTIGSADLCLVAGDSIDDIVPNHNNSKIAILAEPIVTKGEVGELTQ